MDNFENLDITGLDTNVKSDVEQAYDESLRQATYGAVTLAKDKNPDQHAKVLSLAEKMGAKSSFVEENWPTIEKKREEFNLKGSLDSAKDIAPKATEFLSNPDNLAVSKDDIDSLIELERSASKHGFATKANDALGAGMASVWSGIAKTPAFIGNLSLIPSNIIRRQLGEPEVGYSADNSVSKYFEGIESKYLDLLPENNKSFTDLAFKQGKITEAAETLALQFLSNAPNQVIMLGAGMAAGPLVGLGYAGLTTGAQEADKRMDEGQSPLKATAVSAAYGTIEAAFESLGTFGILKSWESAIAKDFGKQSAKEFIQAFGKTFTYSVLGEGNEEAATSLAQDFTDYVTGNPDAMKGSFQRALDAGILGGVSGGGMTAVAGIGSGIAKRKQIQQAKANQEFFLSLGDKSENSKLKERLPEKYQELVEKLTKDGPVENIYISTEAFKEYFQKKGINPTDIANEIGISEQYNTALETGADIEIKTAIMATKLAGTEHYAGLQDDIKFNPEHLSINEIKIRDAEEKRSLEIAAENSRKEYEDAKIGKTEEEVATVEESAKEVGKIIEDQLRSAGYNGKASKSQAQVYEQFFKTQGLKSRISPMDIFKRNPLTIRNLIEQPDIAMEQAASENQTIEIPQGEISLAPATYNEQGMLELDLDHLDILRSRISESDAGERGAIADEQGYTVDQWSSQSTFPEFFKNKGYTKKEALNIIDKYKSSRQYVGEIPKTKKLTEKQNAILEDLYNGMADAINRREYFQKQTDKLIENKNKLEKEGFAFLVSESMVFDENGDEVGGPPMGDVGYKFDVYAQDKTGHDIGGAHFKIDEIGRLVPDDYDGDREAVNVDASFRRKGIATELYRLASEHAGLPVEDVNSKTKLGKEFRDAIRDNKIFYQKSRKQKANVNTNEFKKWFGDSKVVSEKGPSIAYVTLKDKDVDVFNTDGGTGKTHNTGVWLSSSKDVSKTYGAYNGSSETYPVYLRLTNPLIIDANGKSWNNISGDSMVELKDGLFDELSSLIGELAIDGETASTDDLARFARSKGYDGLIVNNVIDRGPFLHKGQDLKRISKPVTTYAVFDKYNLKSVYNNGEFNHKDANIYKQEAKGRITFGNNRQFNIDLFKGKDESTFLHETGHYFFEVMADLAESNANENISKDYQTILNYLGVQNRSEVGVEQHEKLARAWEAYLMKGEAPSNELRKAFSQFKQWLISIYKTVTNSELSPVTPELKGVFDRMLAADEQIEQVEKPKQLFSDPFGILSDDEAMKYLNAAEFAKIHAQDELRAKLMKDLIRKKDSAYKNKYDDIYKNEMAKAKQMPEFKVIELITGEMKLSKPVIEKYYSVFKDSLPFRSTQVDNGIHPDVIASMYGYENGQAMLQAIAPYRRGIESFVEMQVATQMKEIYPELLESPELSDAAIKAAHNENYAQMKKMELDYLAKNDPQVLRDVAKRLIRRMPSNKAVKEQAAKIIAATKVRELKPFVFRNAEKKYASEAAKHYAAGNFDLAFEAKRKEYLNFELYNSAVKAQDDVKESVKAFKKLFKSDEKLSKGRDVDLANAAQAILAEFGITRADKTAGEYLEKMQEYDPESYSVVKALVDSATKNKGDYQNVKYEDFVEMREAVKAIWDLSKARKEIEIDGIKRDVDDVIKELNDQLISITPENKKEYDSTVDKMGIFKEKLLGAKASLVRVEHWAKAVDVKDKGPFWSMIFRPVSDAVTNYRLKKYDVMKRYMDLVKGYEKNITFDAIKSDELKFIFKDKSELMMTVLHSGNESNQRKLLLGRGWATVNDDGSLNTSKWDSFIERMIKEEVLKKEDFDFAQGVWDLLESFKPDAQKSHKKMFGFYFNEITAKEIVTPFGNYRGGYIPAKADVHSVEDAAIRREREAFENNNNSFQFPTTGRGFTKSRVDNYTVPLSLDINMLGSHIDSVMRFTYIEPTVKQVSRIVTDKGFRSQLGKLDSNIGKDTLTPWLQRTAQQKVMLPSEDGLGRLTDAFAKFLRKNVATQMMIGNATNAAQQLTGLIVANAKVKRRHLMSALHNYVMNNKQMTATIMEKSEWMNSTQGQNIFDINNSINEIMFNKSLFENAQEFTRKHTYFLQSATQNMVNSVVWSAAYEQAIEKGYAEKDAIKEADSTVRTTQGTTNPEDISRYETGTATTLLFKQFVSYFNMIANLNASELIKISREVGLRKGAGRVFHLYNSAFMLPAFLSTLMVMAAGGKIDQDDDDSYVDDLLMAFFGSQFKTFAATVPYGGQVAVAAYNTMFTPNMADDRLSLSPAISILESTIVAPAEVYKTIAENGDVKKKTVKDVLQLMGIMTGLPTGPIGKPLGYLMDVESGKANPSGPVDFTRGLITGKSGQ